MEKIKKVCSSKINIFILCILFMFNNMLYAFANKDNTLRVPLLFEPNKLKNLDTIEGMRASLIMRIPQGFTQRENQATAAELMDLVLSNPQCREADNKAYSISSDTDLGRNIWQGGFVLCGLDSRFKEEYLARTFIAMVEDENNIGFPVPGTKGKGIAYQLPVVSAKRTGVSGNPELVIYFTKKFQTEFKKTFPEEFLWGWLLSEIIYSEWRHQIQGLPYNEATIDSYHFTKKEGGHPLTPYHSFMLRMLEESKIEEDTFLLERLTKEEPYGSVKDIAAQRYIARFRAEAERIAKGQKLIAAESPSEYSQEELIMHIVLRGMQYEKWGKRYIEARLTNLEKDLKATEEKKEELLRDSEVKTYSEENNIDDKARSSILDLYLESIGVVQGKIQLFLSTESHLRNTKSLIQELVGSLNERYKNVNPENYKIVIKMLIDKYGEDSFYRVIKNLFIKHFDIDKRNPHWESDVHSDMGPIGKEYYEAFSSDLARIKETHGLPNNMRESGFLVNEITLFGDADFWNSIFYASPDLFLRCYTLLDAFHLYFIKYQAGFEEYDSAWSLIQGIFPEAASAIIERLEEYRQRYGLTISLTHQDILNSI